jgi:prepilin-type processing-associated H-X9-DG protein
MKNQTPRRGFTLLQILIVLTSSVVLAAIAFPFFGRARETHCGPSCQSQLKQIMLGTFQYAQDYDEKFPVLGGSPDAMGWVDALQPYLKSTQIFRCPQEKTAQQTLDPSQPQYTDFWLNARVAGLDVKQFADPARTISLGDGNDGQDLSNARYHLFWIPEDWRTHSDSPLYRHLAGANYAFADGHAKQFTGQMWKNQLDTVQGYTLRLKPTN